MKEKAEMPELREHGRSVPDGAGLDVPDLERPAIAYHTYHEEQQKQKEAEVQRQLINREEAKAGIPKRAAHHEVQASDASPCS